MMQGFQEHFLGVLIGSLIATFILFKVCVDPMFDRLDNQLDKMTYTLEHQPDYLR